MGCFTPGVIWRTLIRAQQLLIVASATFFLRVDRRISQCLDGWRWNAFYILRSHIRTNVMGLQNLKYVGRRLSRAERRTGQRLHIGGLPDSPGSSEYAPHQPKNVTWMISNMEPSWIEPINVTNCPNQVRESQHNHVLTGVTADQKGSQREERISLAASLRSRGTDTGRLFLFDPEVVPARSEN